MSTVTTSTTLMSQALQGVHTAAIQEGVYHAESQGIAGVSDGSRVADLLAKREITLNGINQTTLDRISTAISDGLQNGQDARTIGSTVDAIIDNPTRADMITITETNRLYNAASVDSYQAAGCTQFTWVNDADPCPECIALAGVHSIGDDTPPEHPNCQCYITAILPSGDTTQ
jgi:SPP1 gp7 family putative phage head morphogenesis protein